MGERAAGARKRDGAFRLRCRLSFQSAGKAAKEGEIILLLLLWQLVSSTISTNAEMAGNGSITRYAYKGKKMEFRNLKSARYHVLGKYCTLLNRTGLDYVIIGGWSPEINNVGPITHPGTHDVDVLFKDGRSAHSLEQLIKTSIHEGYLVSAKHSFQLFQPVQVDDKQFLFNIDLMHPSQGETDISFIDQFDLGVFLDNKQEKMARMKSINAPVGEVIFDDICRDLIEVRFELDSVTESKVSIPLVNELGCILTKAISCSKKKRERDSFDIYVAIKQSRDYEKTIEQALRLKRDWPNEFSALSELRKAHRDGTLLKNIAVFADVKGPDYADTMGKFFSDIGL
jgi:hypothetical protein